MASKLSTQIRTQIRIELARRELTQQELAQKLGWSQVVVSKRLRGVTPITTDHLEEIADALEVDVDELIHDDRAAVR